MGLTSRAARISLSPADRAVMAQVFRLQLPWERSAAAAAVAAAAAAASGRSGGSGAAVAAAAAAAAANHHERGRLIHRRDLPQAEQGQTALNCIRWIPVAGQGIVYATNTGLLKILR